MNKENEGFRREMWLIYELAKDAGQRVFTYFFPDCTCPHTQIAIDVAIRNIWMEIENERNKASKSNSQTPTEPEKHPKESPVMVANA